MREKLGGIANTATTATVEPPAPVDRSPEDVAFLKSAALTLVTHLFSSIKTVRLYEMNNRAAQRSLAELAANIAALHEREGRASVRVSNDLLLINDFRPVVDSQHYGPFEYVSTEMKKREIDSIDFAGDATAEQLGTFLRVLNSVDAVEAAYDTLQQRMGEASVTAVTTARAGEHETVLADPQQVPDTRQESNRVYFRTVALVGDILRTIEEKHILQVRKAKRLTQQMVDIIQTDESMLVGLASIKNFDAYTFAHSVNVCILSMLIGDRMHLEKSDVARLGVAGLFHDIGKTYIPSSILNSTGQLSPREWELMKYHTFFGVKELSRMRSLRDAIDPMFVALQHHVHLNNNGYPLRPGGWKLRLFSRVVTVADYYDAMTAFRAYQKVPVTPDKALRFILEKSGDIFDPFIAKVFIQAMGLYPIGTIVKLDTGETAVVVRQNPDARFIHRPTVEIVDETAGIAADRELVDLAQRTPESSSFRRSIVHSIHDSEIALDKRPLFVVT